MDKLDSVRQQLNEEKTQFPNLVRPAAFRVEGLDWRIPVYNGAGGGGPTIAALHVAKVSSGVLSNATFVGRTWQSATLTVPDADSMTGNIVVNLLPIAPGETGWGTSMWPAPVLNTGGWVVDEEVGTQAGSWDLSNTKTGFKVVALSSSPVSGAIAWIVPITGGEKGYQGPQGTNPGPQGPAGGSGEAGAQGPQGWDGWQGVQGDIGAQGWQGTGAQGYQGWQGRQGWQGWQGLGANGNQGAQGIQGPQSAGGGLPAGIGQYKVITSLNGSDAVWDYPRGHA